MSAGVWAWGTQAPVDGACGTRTPWGHAIFTRLTRDDGTPRTEALRAETLPWRAGRLTATWRAIIAVPLILGLVTLFVLTAINGSAPQGCRPGPVMRTVSCQSAQGPEGHT